MMEYTKYTFKDICLPKGFVRGPFGSALKKSLFVPKGEDTYKVYEQCVPLEQNKYGGHYYISGEYFRKSLSRFEVKHNDFLVSCSGMNYGAIYHLQEPFEKGVINQALLIIRIDNTIVDYNYFKYLFRAVLSRIITTGTGNSTIPNFPSIDVIKEIDVYLPSLEVQKKIGNTLNDIEDKIKLNNNINSNLQKQLKLIYDYWFTQFDFPNEDGTPYRSSGGEMVWNEQLKREIPKGWSNCKLKDYVDNITQTTVPGEHLKDLFYTPIDEIPRRKMSFYGGLPHGEANSSLQLYKENDILIGAMRVYFHRVCIAAQNGITRSTTIVLRVCNIEILPFVYELFNQEQTIQYANKISVGTQQPYVKWDGSLDSMDVILPAHSVITDFCEHVNHVIEKVKCVEKENYELTKLRDWLLPMLMNGQATVE